MCVLLATAGPPAASAAAVTAAKAALDNPLLCGEPQLREADAGAAPAAGYREASPGALGSGFDMGAPVPVAEPEWSGAHRGVCLYASRLLAGVWDEPVVTPLRGSPALVRCRLPTEALQVSGWPGGARRCLAAASGGAPAGPRTAANQLRRPWLPQALEERLRALDAFLADYAARRGAARRPGAPYIAAGIGAGADGGPGGGAAQTAKRQRLEDAQAAELRRTRAVRALVARAAESVFLLRVLVRPSDGCGGRRGRTPPAQTRRMPH